MGLGGDSAESTDEGGDCGAEAATHGRGAGGVGALGALEHGRCTADLPVALPSGSAKKEQQDLVAGLQLLGGERAPTNRGQLGCWGTWLSRSCYHGFRLHKLWQSIVSLAAQICSVVFKSFRDW